MATMTEAQLNTLRVELKQWEKAFADANGGRKAGRHDIKQDPEIAAKYKTYGRLRALEESSLSTLNAGPGKHNSKDIEKTPSKADQHHARSKRKYASLTTDDNGADGHGYTPRKARREIVTPAKNRMASDHPYDSPSAIRRLFSPTTHRQQQEHSPLPLKTAIGPTPQRNGKILGLFDMLSASGGSTATPSANRVAALDQALVQTPSRNKVQKLGDIPEAGDNEDDGDDESSIAMGRTPASSSKHLYLERLFATPTTLRFATMIEQDDDAEAASQRVQLQMEQAAAQADENQRDNKNPLGLDTPSFLRRASSGRNNGLANTNPLSPVGVRKHQRFSNGKGLTALVQGLRDMEKERMDEDWDILNEIEAEQRGDVQVGDSQAPPQNNENANHQPGKIWKKKTQKRTTRLVKMRPVMQVKSKPSRTATTTTTSTTSNKPTRESEKDEDVDDHEEEEGDDNQQNTRALRERKQGPIQQDPDNDENEEEDSDAIDSDNSSDKDFAMAEPAAPKQQQQKPSSFTEKIKAAFLSVSINKKKDNDDDNNNDKKKKKKKDKNKENEKEAVSASSPKKRKINPDAHANYRSLKIRSKGQGGFRKGGGRFGRR